MKCRSNRKGTALVSARCLFYYVAVGITAYDVRVIADGLLLAKALHGEVTRDNVARLLSEPIHAASLPVLPDWVHVKRFIEHHPEYIGPRERREWWRNSDRSSTDRRKLVREFAASVCGAPDAAFTILTPRLRRNNGDVAGRVLRDFDRVVEILNDGVKRPSERRSALISILGKK